MDKYNPLKVALLGSGFGTSVVSVCNAVKHKLLNVNITCIVSNNEYGNKFKLLIPKSFPICSNLLPYMILTFPRKS